MFSIKRCKYFVSKLFVVKILVIILQDKHEMFWIKWYNYSAEYHGNALCRTEVGNILFNKARNKYLKKKIVIRILFTQTLVFSKFFSWNRHTNISALTIFLYNVISQLNFVILLLLHRFSTRNINITNRSESLWHERE